MIKEKSMKKLLVTIFAAGVLLSSLSYSGTIFEDFQGFDVGWIGSQDYIFYSDSSQYAYPAYIDIVDEDQGIKAAGFTFRDKWTDYNDDTLLNPGDWIYFETTNLADTGQTASWFESHLSFVTNPTVAAANADNPSLIDEVWWFAYSDDRYFESRATAAGDAGTPLNSHDTLQAYPKLYFADAIWDEYDPQQLDAYGNYLAINQGTSVDSSFLESLTKVGIQMRTTNFDTAGENDYLTVWVDNISAESEPPTRRGRRDRLVLLPPPAEQPINRPSGVSR